MALNFNASSLSEQFRDLNWKDVGTWPSAPKWAVLALIFLLIAFLAWYFVLDDKWTEYELAQQQEVKLRLDYTDRLKKSVNLQALKDQKVKVTAYVAALEQQLPDKAEMDKLLSDVNYAGVSKGLQFELFKPGTVKIENYYAELPINIKLTGTYHQLAGFAADLSALSRIVTLNNMTMTAIPNTSNTGGYAGQTGNPVTSSANALGAGGNPTALLSLDAIAKTFRYLDKDETELVAKSKQGLKK
jgi:type IV pilus assembly protein PilO